MTFEELMQQYGMELIGNNYGKNRVWVSKAPNFYLVVDLNGGAQFHYPKTVEDLQVTLDSLEPPE